jgi:hypothetical protein
MAFSEINIREEKKEPDGKPFNTIFQ